MMNKALANLALRRQLLLARSSLCRLKIRHEVGVLREGLAWRQVAVAAAQSHTTRSAAFLLAAELVGHERMARMLVYAGRATALARLARLAIALLHRQPADPAGPPQP
jgi:hypothetical protein